MHTSFSFIKLTAAVILALSAIIPWQSYAAAAPTASAPSVSEARVSGAKVSGARASEANVSEARALQTWETATQDEYRICPGDLISINVWNEETLTQPKVLVRPDGFISMPLIGDVPAGGISVQHLQQVLTERLIAFLKDKPIITVSVLQLSGNNIFVLGKVNRPGAYNMVSSLDVTQALALAGGLAVFADEDDIVVLHRSEKGIQEASKFPYDQIKNGKQLQANQILRSGDVIIVP